jgi:ribosomal protein S12 methylthiotransferase accessory factor
MTILDCWDELVDPRVGIIRKIRALPVDEDEPNFFHYLSTACDTSAFTSYANFANNGGVATTRHAAIAKAMGEAVERYCAAIVDEEDLIVARYDELDVAATDPSSFTLYSAEQYAAPGFSYVPFTAGTRAAWTRGTSLITGEPILVPAAAVHVPYFYEPDRGDPPVMQPISTGLACGSGWTAAALGGLCEAIERDAFTITWQSRLSRPRIDPATLPAAARERVARFAAHRLRVEVADITTDIGCPVALTVAVGAAPTSPAIAVAAAADPVFEVALTKSLEELAHTRKYAAQLMDHTPEVPLDVAAGHPAVQSQREHLRLYCPQEAVDRAAFLWAGETVACPGGDVPAAGRDVEAALASVVEQVARSGLHPIACELTTPDVAQIGLAVVRVVVPGLHPLYMGHRNRALGGRRLYEVPSRLGHRPLRPGEPDNPYPHPFP